MIMKYLLVLAVLVVAYLLWRNARIGDRDKRSAAPPPVPPRVGREEMVCCPVCSVHLPQSDALAGPDGRYYCSQEHRLLGQRK